MGYKPKKLGHVNIFVRNAERARDWYVVSAELLLNCGGVRDQSGNKSNEMARYLRARSPSWVKKPLG